MPEPVESGVDISEIKTDETAFDEKTLVITGAGDQQSAALGVGVTKPGEIKCTTGTGSFVLGYLKEPKFDPERRVLCSCHAIPGAWVQEASMFTTGAVLRWFRDEVGHVECKKGEEEGIDPYDVMTRIAAESPPGADGLLLIPHLVGAGAPHWNPHSKGLLFGLSLGHERKDVYRAILEGVAFEVRKNIEIFKKIGMEPKELKLTGGGSRSALWNQIMADVLGVTCVRNVIEEATSLGAAILAASGAGLFPDISEAAEKLCKVQDKYLPHEEKTQFYKKIYDLSYEIYTTLNKKNLFTRFDDLFASSSEESSQ
jgi:sugar (pentulose or hexulose) kinase